MAERTIVLRFINRNLENAKLLAKVVFGQVRATVDAAERAEFKLKGIVRAQQSARDARVAANRKVIKDRGGTLVDAGAGAGVLRRAQAGQGAAGQVLNRGLTGARSATSGVSALFSGGGNLSAGLATQLAFLLPQTVITALAIQVTNQVMREVDARLALQQRAEEDLARVRAERAAETVAQRAKRDPAFEREANREAGEALRARRAYEARVGIEPTAARAAGE